MVSVARVTTLAKSCGWNPSQAGDFLHPSQFVVDTLFIHLYYSPDLASLTAVKASSFPIGRSIWKATAGKRMCMTGNLLLATVGLTRMPFVPIRLADTRPDKLDQIARVRSRLRAC